MPAACDMLSVAGQNFLTASQRVGVENYGRESRRHLIRTAKDILEGTLKVVTRHCYIFTFKMWQI